MSHEYKIGDIVRIKQEEKESNLYPYSYSRDMKNLAGTICKITKISPVDFFPFPESKYINNDYNMYDLRPIDPSDHRDFVWTWHSSMFEPVLDSELQTSTSLNKGELLSICNMTGKIQYYNGTDYSGYYLDLEDITKHQTHFACCAKLRKLVPNFDKIADEFHPTQHQFGYFPEFVTINDLLKFVQAINNTYNSKKLITPKTLNENEIKFQRPKASFVRGSIPEGHQICGRRNKTAIGIGHLSNRACNF